MGSDLCTATWSLETPAGLPPSGCQSYAEFGWGIDVQGSRVVVGAALEDSPQVDRGAVYVFERTGTTWAQSAHILAGNGAAGDEFGVDVSLDGDSILVGARLDDAPDVDRGSAYVFVEQGGFWFFQQQLTALGGAAYDYCGLAVALQGDVAIVGAPLYDLLGMSDAGSAALFRRSGTTWTQDQSITACDATGGDQFATSVALDGGTAILGAYLDDDTVGDSGSAPLFSISKGQFDRFGFGDGSGTSCPCDNDSVPGLEQGCKNSFTGGGSSALWGAKLSVAGTDSASADDFRMLAGNLVPNNPALLFSGPNTMNGGAGVVFGNGLRLVGGFIVRRGITAPNGDGRATWGPGIGASNGWTPGNTVHFQVWYRDPFHTCADVFNLTNGVSIQFRP